LKLEQLSGLRLISGWSAGTIEERLRIARVASMRVLKVILALLSLAVLTVPAHAASIVPPTKFRICSSRVYSTCVIDGDTFRWKGDRIRLVDVDAPETHPPRCQYEADLGERATLRLQQLLTAGGWSLERSGDRDHDKYGRLLRLVAIGDTDAGAILVEEGLARPWDGSRHPWC